MLKKLFNFKMSKQMVMAKVFMLVCMAVAIVVTFLGLREIVDVKHMKEVLDATRPLMGDVLLYLLKKYLVWALLVLFAGVATFVGVRFAENNKKA
ncbi:MAG: hypothetical protein ACI4WX_09320 [Aristaeellaceae bacterium]